MPSDQRNSFIRTVRPAGSVRLLGKRRMWFTDDDKGEQGGGTGDPGKYNPASLEDAMKIINSLVKRVDERDTEKGELAKQLKAFQQAQQAQLAEQGNFKTLAEQHAAELAKLAPVVERAAALEGVIRESNDTRVKRIPEAMRSMIPTEYAPEKLQAWLNANEALLTKLPAPDYDAGAGGGSGGTRPVELTAEEKAMARQMRISDEAYAKQKQAIADKKKT